MNNMSLKNAGHGNHHSADFLDEKKIELYFKGKFKNKRTTRKTAQSFPFEKWYEARKHHPFTYGHDETIGPKSFDCDTITDEWFRWFLTTPVSENTMTNPRNAYGDKNTFLMDKNETFVYFAAASPFQDPTDFKRIVMTRNAPLLVPVYIMTASPQEYPSLTTEAQLTRLIQDDLAGIFPEEVSASLDGEPIYGCSVIRNKFIEIANIPKDNVLGIPERRLQETNSTIKLCHGGFWLLIKEDRFSSGDHLLSFSASSKNYEMRAKLLISAQW